MRLRRIGALLCIAALAGCSEPGSPSASTLAASASMTSGAATPGVATAGPTTQVSPVADGWLRISWTTVVPTPAVSPHGGFEHNDLASGRGAMILVRNLEAAATTLVSTTPDGTTWAVAEVRSSTIRFGYAVDGADDWLQVVARADGGPGLELVASTDGLTWDTRGRLPDAMRSAGDSAVNGSSLLVCGFGRGVLENQAICALSRDRGVAWEPAGNLGNLVGVAGIRAMAALGSGFVALVAAEREGESIVLTSTDGTSWTRQHDPLPSGGLAAVNFGSAVYVTGLDGVIWTSREGASWSRVALPSMQPSWLSFVIAGDALVAYGVVVQPEGNAHLTTLLVTKDGATWRADAVSPAMHEQPDPLILPVRGGLLLVGDPGMTVGRPISAADPGPT